MRDSACQESGMMTNLQTTKALQRARGVADLAFDKQQIARMYQSGSS